MHPLDELGDEIQILRVKETLQPQDKDRIQELTAAVEAAYPDQSLPDSWLEFTDQLDSVLNGVRDSETTDDLYDAYTVAKYDISQLE